MFKVEKMSALELEDNLLEVNQEIREIQERGIKGDSLEYACRLKSCLLTEMVSRRLSFNRRLGA